MQQPIPASIERRGFAKDHNALAHYQHELAITNDEFWLIATYRRETWNFSQPAPSIRYLAAKYRKSRATLYAWRNGLVAKGLLSVARRSSPGGRCLASAVDFAPLWAQLDALCARDDSPAETDSPEAPSAGQAGRPLPDMEDSPLPASPAMVCRTGRPMEDSPEESPEDPEDAVPSVWKRQCGKLARDVARRVRLKGHLQERHLVSHLMIYAELYELDRAQLERAITRTLADRRYATWAAFWTGLDHYREQLLGKAVAA